MIMRASPVFFRGAKVVQRHKKTSYVALTQEVFHETFRYALLSGRHRLKIKDDVHIIAHDNLSQQFRERLRAKGYIPLGAI